MSIRRWILISAVLVMINGISAFYGYNHINNGAVGGMNFNTPLEEWQARLAGGDSGYYLGVGMNYAAGLGITEPCRGCDPATLRPAVLWGPGGPWVIGVVLRLTHAKTILPYFIFIILSQFFVTVVMVSTLALYSKDIRAILLGAVFSSVCLPLLDFYYSAYLTLVEPISFIPYSLALFALAKGMLAIWNSSEKWIKAGIWFFAAGIFIGLASLVRSSIGHFSIFVAAMVILLAVIRMRKRIWVAVICGLLLVIGTQAMRQPVKYWNKHRAGIAEVAMTDNSLWRHVIWSKTDSVNWYYTSGIGLGHTLDPEAASRVEKAFADGHGTPWMSFKELMIAVIKNPLKALDFKIKRLPVLFLGTVEWPNSTLSLISGWCIAFYLLLFTYLILCVIKKTWPAEILYLYFCFLLASSVLIHFEFRYSFPCWLTLNLVPGYLFALIFPLKSSADQ